MVLNKIKKAWGWWQARPKGTRLMVYFFLAWEAIGVTAFLLSK